MAGVSSATLITKISEKITLNGNKYDNIVEKRISGISDIFKRIVTIPADSDLTDADTGKTTIVSFSSTTAISDGALDIQNVKYIRLTNLDDTNTIGVSLQIDIDEDDSAVDGDDDSHEFNLEAGMSWIFGSPHDSVIVDDDDPNITELSVRRDLQSIMIDPASNAVDVEILIASS